MKTPKESEKVMGNGNEKITAIGKRLKQEAKKRGLSNQDVADLIGYSSGKQISPIYSGKKPLSDDQVVILSKAWNLRKEYLMCIEKSAYAAERDGDLSHR